ncbi:MAG: PGPGW domain-containing protein [Spirochaetia bacterium]
MRTADIFYSNRIILSLLGGFSVVAFVGTLIAIPFLLIRLPWDYFTRVNYTPPLSRRILRNFAGSLLLIAGLAMLFLPGQGLLTLFIALTLIDFPKKRKLEIAILQKPRVKNAVDSLRARYGREPITLPKASQGQSKPQGRKSLPESGEVRKGG